MSTYGIDYSTYPITDTTFNPILDDETFLKQDVARKLTTPPGDLFWAEAGTYDARDLLGDKIIDTNEWASKFESLFEEDPRMTVAMSVSIPDNDLQIDATITGSSTPPFTTTFFVGSNGIEIEGGS